MASTKSYLVPDHRNPAKASNLAFNETVKLLLLIFYLQFTGYILFHYLYIDFKYVIPNSYLSRIKAIDVSRSLRKSYLTPKDLSSTLLYLV